MSDTDEFQDVWAKATALAWQDAAFKKDLLNDARGALLSNFSYTLPADLDLRVVEDAKATTPVTLGHHNVTVVLLLAKPAAGGVGPVSFGEASEAVSFSICVC